jgi:hypothetical protein
VREQQLQGAPGAWDAGRGEHGKIIDRGAPIEKKSHFVRIVNRSKKRSCAILAPCLDVRTAFDQVAHHVDIRVQSSTHERGVPPFIARVGIRSLLEQLLHLRCVAVADGGKEVLVEGVLDGPISRPRRGMRTGERDNENEEESDTKTHAKHDPTADRRPHFNTFSRR